MTNDSGDEGVKKAKKTKASKIEFPKSEYEHIREENIANNKVLFNQFAEEFRELGLNHDSSKKRPQMAMGEDQEQRQSE